MLNMVYVGYIDYLLNGSIELNVVDKGNPISLKSSGQFWE